VNIFAVIVVSLRCWVEELCYICSGWTWSGRVWFSDERHMACTKWQSGTNVLCRKGLRGRPFLSQKKN